MKRTVSKVGKPRTSKSKIFSRTALARKLASRKKTKVVFTNGCFDLIHPGHVSYLEKARKLGDFLVVALNSDDSVRKLKGPSRPVNPLKSRMEVMAALECVDFVTSFSEDTPLETIRLLKPHILVKGGDYDLSTIVGAKEVRALGGKVKALPFVDGHSTTAILKKSRD